MKIISLFCLLLAGCLGKSQPKESVIQMLLFNGMGGGTGFEVLSNSGNKYTITNRHVCLAGAIVAKVGNVRILLRIREISDKTDLCILEPIPDLPALRLAKQSAHNDDNIDIYGYGWLMPVQHTEGRWVSILPDGPYMQSLGLNQLGVPSMAYATATVTLGNSGSPVLNSDGDVVGIVFATGEKIANRSLIIPLEDIKDFLSKY